MRALMGNGCLYVSRYASNEDKSEAETSLEDSNAEIADEK